MAVSHELQHSMIGHNLIYVVFEVEKYELSIKNAIVWVLSVC